MNKFFIADLTDAGKADLIVQARYLTGTEDTDAGVLRAFASEIQKLEEYAGAAAQRNSLGGRQEHTVEAEVRGIYTLSKNPEFIRIDLKDFIITTEDEAE